MLDWNLLKVPGIGLQRQNCKATNPKGTTMTVKITWQENVGTVEACKPNYIILATSIPEPFGAFITNSTSSAADIIIKTPGETRELQNCLLNSAKLKLNNANLKIADLPYGDTNTDCNPTNDQLCDLFKNVII